MKTRCALCAVLFFATVAVAKDKPRVWQSGKLLDTSQQHYFSVLSGIKGSSAREEPEDAAILARLSNKNIKFYVVEADDYVYWVSQKLKSSRPANLVENAPVKFALKKKELFLLDKDNKQIEMDVLKKTFSGVRK